MRQGIVWLLVAAAQVVAAGEPLLGLPRAPRAAEAQVPDCFRETYIVRFGLGTGTATSEDKWLAVASPRFAISQFHPSAALTGRIEGDMKVLDDGRVFLAYRILMEGPAPADGEQCAVVRGERDDRMRSSARPAQEKWEGSVIVTPGHAVPLLRTGGQTIVLSITRFADMESGIRPLAGQLEDAAADVVDPYRYEAAPLDAGRGRTGAGMVPAVLTPSARGAGTRP